MATKFYNISTDTTLGENNASDNIVSSQKAIKTYVDSTKGMYLVTFNSEVGESIVSNKSVADIYEASLSDKYIIIGRLEYTYFYLIQSTSSNCIFISCEGNVISGSITSMVETWRHQLIEYLETPSVGATSGQVLANDGLGTNYWTTINQIGNLISDTQLWTLDKNAYFVNGGIKLYYDGSDEGNYITSNPGIIVVTKTSTSNVWTYYPTQSSEQTKFIVYCGYSTSTSGNYYAYNMIETTNQTYYALGVEQSAINNFNDVSTYSFLMTNGTVLVSFDNATLNIPKSLTGTFSYSASLVVNDAVFVTTPTTSTTDDYYIRQDLYIQNVNKHFYRLCKFYNNVFSVDTTLPNADENGWVEVVENLPSYSGNTGKFLGLTNNGLEWVNGGSSNAITATELVSTLCGDSDFQTWAAEQVPPIPVVEPLGWDDDITTIISVYSSFIEDTNNVSTSWGTVIANNVDGDGELYAINSYNVTGGDLIPQQSTAPLNPQENDLWIDTSEEVSVPNTIPVPTVSDSGKFLVVNSNGEYVLMTISNANDNSY